METTTFEKLNDEQKKLLNEAEVILKNSYSPYSKFKVGAALLTEDNKLFTGTNFENASFGASICAERACISGANSNGYNRVKKIAIIAKSDKINSDFIVSPCGICRQVILESAKISEVDIEIIMSNKDKTKIIISTINELLPLAFKLDKYN
ncbi:MAG: cytidine deaminase [Spirochaetes bacterium]|nr:cytidine deaminase [Spirochaetota bacterium]